MQPVAVDLEQRELKQQYTMLQRSVNRSRGRNIYHKSYCLWEPPKFDTIYHAVVLVCDIYPAVIRIWAWCRLKAVCELLRSTFPCTKNLRSLPASTQSLQSIVTGTQSSRSIAACTQCVIDLFMLHTLHSPSILGIMTIRGSSFICDVSRRYPGTCSNKLVLVLRY